MSAATRAPLTRDRIVDAAVALADAGGIRAVSMRKVAAELGFEVMSLYNHVTNKSDLIFAMVDRVAAELDVGAVTEDWRPAMRAHAIAVKELFERHRWLVAEWSRTMPGPVRFDHMEWQLATLAAADLGERRAHDAFHAINNHVVGYMLSNAAMDLENRDQQAMLDEVMSIVDDERHPHVLHHIDQHLRGDSGPSFEFVLDLLLDGIAG